MFRTVLAKMPQLANCSKELNHLIGVLMNYHRFPSIFFKLMWVKQEGPFWILVNLADLTDLSRQGAEGAGDESGHSQRKFA